MSDSLRDNPTFVEFILAYADDLEKHGVATMRSLLDEDPATFRKLFARFFDRRRIGRDISDEQLARISERIVVGLREEARWRMH
jgi:hypothetical protein